MRAPAQVQDWFPDFIDFLKLQSGRSDWPPLTNEPYWAALERTLQQCRATEAQALAALELIYNRGWPFPSDFPRVLRDTLNEVQRVPAEHSPERVGKSNRDRWDALPEAEKSRRRQALTQKYPMFRHRPLVIEAGCIGEMGDADESNS